MNNHNTTWVNTSEPAWLGGKRVECTCGWRSENIGNYQSTQFADLREAEREHIEHTRRMK